MADPVNPSLDDAGPSFSRQDRIRAREHRLRLVGQTDHMIEALGLMAHELASFPEQAALMEDLLRMKRGATKARDLVVLLDPAVLETWSLACEEHQARRDLRHDLRASLGIVKGFAEEILEAGELVQSEYFPDLKKIVRQARDAIEQVDMLLPRESADGLRDNGRAAVIIPPAPPRGQVLLGGRVLIVDDTPENRALLVRQMMAISSNIAPVEATGGEQALTLLADLDIDAVLLDLNMPGMNGYQVLERMKLVSETKQIPVIMISGIDFDQAALQAIGMGAEDFLQRPIDPRLLRARLGACLDRKVLNDRGKRLLAQVRHQAREFNGLLRSILPDQVLLEMRNGRYPPRRVDNVCVLFADLVGFTKFCRNADPELVIQPLQNLIERWEDAAQSFSVQKIKTIGDALMCASGLLTPEMNPVEVCVRYGLELMRITREINPEWDLRVGIHVGPVVAGIVGRRQFLFDLWGDTVNTASRMESCGEKGRICLSEEAYMAISRISRATLRGGHEVKSLGKVNQYLFEGFIDEVSSE